MKFARHRKLEIALRRKTVCSRLAALMAATLVFAACGKSGDGSSGQDKSEEKMAPQSNGPGPGGGPASVPEGAIPIGEDLYMVPAGRDNDGCEQFTAWSSTKAVAQVIYYRARSGGFTTSRGQADCGKG